MSLHICNRIIILVFNLRNKEEIDQSTDFGFKDRLHHKSNLGLFLTCIVATLKTEILVDSYEAIVSSELIKVHYLHPCCGLLPPSHCPRGVSWKATGDPLQ